MFLPRVSPIMLETTDYEPNTDRSVPCGDEGRAAIAARALRRSFKGGIEAVREIDLTVCRGEVFGFLGPNGMVICYSSSPS